MPPKKVKPPSEAVAASPGSPLGSHPRLRKLIVKNFRCIGKQPVEIDLAEIVVLVGPNNVGKSTILKAYQTVMAQGSGEGKLSFQDFPGGEVDKENLPEIELVTVVSDDAPGKQWIYHNKDTGEDLVRERWTWSQPGDPKREGFDVEKQQWDAAVPWGAPNVANARRPQPHRVDAFASPQTQAKEIVDLLQTAIKERIESIKPGADKEKPEAEESDYQKLLKSIGSLQKSIVEQTKTEIEKVETSISSMIQEVFPQYAVAFDARPEQELDQCLNLFKGGAQLLMGPKLGYMGPIETQGSGARRTLLWTALKLLAEEGKGKKKAKDSDQRPHLLLIDEPEICLHPNAIRQACRLLYDLPQKTGNWQVMVTTHSPAFVDLSRNNTTIVRVELQSDGSVHSTTVFRPATAQLSMDDRENLKALNMCDPYVAEFFFGGDSVIVEGDTEYTAFKYVIGEKPDEFRNVHIIRARGKATIVTLAKVLNQFGAHYAVLHDSDKPTFTNSKGEVKNNPAWTLNSRILETINNAPLSSKVRLMASVPNFEKAFFGKEATDEKPYSALQILRAAPKALGTIESLLQALLGKDGTVPPQGALEWDDITKLEAAVMS